MSETESQTQSCKYCQQGEMTHWLTGTDFDSATQPYPLHRCNHCLSAELWPHPDADCLDASYSPAYYGSASRKFNPIIEALTVRANHWRARKIYRHFLHHNADAADQHEKTANKRLQVLDIGCGRGNLLRAFATLGCSCLGIERPGMHFADLPADITIIHDDLQSAQIPDNSVDIIVIWHVLEHLRDPEQVLAECRRIAAPGALLVIEVPNFASWQARLSGRHWFHLDLPRHLHHFTPGAIDQMTARQDFRTRGSATLSLEQGLFGTLQSLLNGLSGRNNNRFYQLLKAQGPRAKPGERVSWALLACCLMPVTLIEFVLSTLAGRGAVYTSYSIFEPGQDQH